MILNFFFLNIFYLFEKEHHEFVKKYIFLIVSPFHHHFWFSSLESNFLRLENALKFVCRSSFKFLLNVYLILKSPKKYHPRF